MTTIGADTQQEILRAVLLLAARSMAQSLTDRSVTAEPEIIVDGDIVVIYLGERWMIGEVDEHGVDVTAVCSDTIGYRRYALGSGLTSDREIASAVERWRRDVLGYGDVR